LVLLTVVDIPGVPTVSAAASIACEVLSPAGFSNVSVVPAVVGVPTVADAPVVNIPSV
jgi:hypothetical protein